MTILSVNNRSDWYTASHKIGDRWFFAASITRHGAISMVLQQVRRSNLKI